MLNAYMVYSISHFCHRAIFFVVAGCCAIGWFLMEKGFLVYGRQWGVIFLFSFYRENILAFAVRCGIFFSAFRRFGVSAYSFPAAFMRG
jgi:hypothetical protein